MANEGEGQVVVLSGEAVIGKSRILAALRERIGDEPHLRERYQCSPHHANDAFYPITSQIWHAAGFVNDEQAATRLDKLEAMIARSGADLSTRGTNQRRPCPGAAGGCALDRPDLARRVRPAGRSADEPARAVGYCRPA